MLDFFNSVDFFRIVWIFFFNTGVDFFFNSEFFFLIVGIFLD